MTKKNFTTEHHPRMPDFMANLPRVPDFMENLPKAAPWPPPAAFELGAPLSQRRDPTLIDAYFRGDLRPLLQDMAARPDHYTSEQKEILQALEQKKPLPAAARNQDISEIVMRFTERTDPKKRETAISAAQKKLTTDPTVQRKMEQDKKRKADEEAEQTYERQEFPKSIKII